MALASAHRTAYLVTVLVMSITTDQASRLDRDPYEEALARALFPAKGCAVQFAAIPSFRPEWSVCVVREARGGRIEVATMDPMLYGEVMTRIYAAAENSTDGVYLGPEAVEQALRTFTPTARRRSAPISSETMDALASLWRSAMSRPRERQVGVDGAAYFIAARTDGPWLGEWFAWSPRRGTPEAAFLEFVRRLVDYTNAPEGARAELDRAISIDAETLRSR